MSIYIYKGNNQVSTNAIRNDKAVKAIYAKEQGKDVVCVWGIDTSIPYDQMFTYSIVDNTIKITGLKPEVKTVYITIPDTISNKLVSSIGALAFRDKTKILNVIISNSITDIGKGTFSGCSSLESITIPFVGAKSGVTSSDTYQYPFGYIFGEDNYTGGIRTYQNYYGSSTSSATSTTYYIPSSLKSVTVMGGNILYGAFSACTELTDVTIGNSVQEITNKAFTYCTNLTTINWYADNCKYVGNLSDPIFIDCPNLVKVNIGNNVKAIPSYIFSNCTELRNIIIPDSVTNIGDCAFKGCSSVKSITIPDNVVSIGDNAFQNCTSLTTVNWNATDCTVAGSYNNAIFGSTYVTEINIGNNVKTIPSYAFYQCNRFKDIIIPNSVTSIGNSAFSGCSGLTSITIPNSVTSIGAEAFWNCDSLTSITIPDSVTSISNWTFANCDYLTSIIIPNSVKTIGYAAFYSCQRLMSIPIPNSVTSIGGKAFAGCIRLITINFNGTKAQWNAISKDTDWNYNTGNYTIHCTDGDITK